MENAKTQLGWPDGVGLRRWSAPPKILGSILPDVNLGNLGGLIIFALTPQISKRHWILTATNSPLLY